MTKGMGFWAVVCGLVVATSGVGLTADGAAVWEKHCGSCHGADGKGDTKAGKLIKVEDLTSAEVKAKLSAASVKKSTEEGILDKETGKSRMKGFKDKLSAEEIDAVVKHTLGLAGVK